MHMRPVRESSNGTGVTNVLSALVIVAGALFVLLAVFCGANVTPLPLIVVISCLALLYAVFSKFGVPRGFPIILFVVSFALCCVFTALLDNPVVQDFLRQLEAAEALLAGNSGAFATEYFEKYPYQIGWSIVEFALLSIWNSTVCVKLFCCLCVALTVLLSFFLMKELSDEKVAAAVSCGIALYPTIVLMPGSTSNQALSTLLCFTGFCVLICHRKKGAELSGFLPRIVIAGLLFAQAEMIRPDVIIIVLAGMIALFIKDFIKGEGGAAAFVQRGVGAVSLFVVYKLGVFLLSSAIIAAGFATSFSSDAMYKIAVGTNLESNGAWSAEVVERLDEKKAAGLAPSDASFEVVKENLEELSEPGNLTALIKGKNQKLWWEAGFYFSTLTAESSVKIALLHIDKAMLLVGLLLCLYSMFAAFRRKDKGKDGCIFLLLTVVLYAAAYQIIEVQPRYIYTELFVVFILAADGLAVLRDDCKRMLSERASRESAGERRDEQRPLLSK